MNGIMYDYIYEQPEALSRVLDNRAEDAARFTEIFLSKRPKRIYLIGSGSSLNASKAAAPLMEELLETEVTPIASSMIPVIREPNSFLLFISQGGNSTNTVAAIKACTDYPHLAVTGTEDCMVNRVSEHVLIRCGEEKAGPKSKGYLCTFFALYCMALECANSAQLISSEEYIRRVCEAKAEIAKLEENIKSVEAWVRERADMLKDMTKVVCIGKGIGQAVSLECALKLQETMLIPAAGYEYEEFLHGPDMSIDEKMAGIYLLPPESDPDYARFEGLIAYHRRKSPYVITVSGGEGLNDINDIHCGCDAPKELRIFNWTIPAQMIASEITLMIGKQGKGSEIFYELDEVLSIKAKLQK